MLKLAGAFSSQAKQANVPMTSTVALHGNRMVRSNPHTTEIIDLDQQTMTSIDHDKHTYSVVTFQQMQQAMADAAAKANSSNAAAPASNSGGDLATAGVLLESQTETGNFSTAPVDLNSFQIPAGYKQVTSPMVRH